MDRLRRLPSWIEPGKIPFSAFEVLIYKDGKITLWEDYLYAIRSFLSDSNVSKSHLIIIFRRTLKRKIHEWLKLDRKDKDEEATDFFKRTYFCLKTLCARDSAESDMNTSEAFAYKVGKIARGYINFKNRIDEETNSLRDILTYSKYDREKLRFVFSRLSLGINLSKADEKEMAQINKLVSLNLPFEEIPDDSALNDYTYFFYKGYFEEGGADNK
jgi:hypothetical protein